jgi:hypothetical protein
VGVVFAGAPEEEPPPQPLSKDRPAANTTSTHRDSQRRRLFHHSPPSESTRTDGGNSGAGPVGRAAVAEGAVIVTVVETGPLEGVTVVGVKCVDMKPIARTRTGGNRYHVDPLDPFL